MTAITLTTTNASGGGGGSSVPTGNVLWVDSVNGNNGTAVSGQLDKPYLTIAAALGAAVSGDLSPCRSSCLSFAVACLEQKQSDSS